MSSHIRINENPEVALGLDGNPNRIEFMGPQGGDGRYVLCTTNLGNSEPPDNAQLHLGWNVNTEGHPQSDTEPVIRCTWDANFLNGESNRFMRFRLVYETASGATVKTPIHCSVQRSNDIVRLGFFDATPVAQPTDIVALTDNLAGTVSRTLAALSNVTGNNAMDLRDSINNTLIPSLRNVLSSLADYCNDVRAQQQSLGLMA